MFVSDKFEVEGGIEMDKKLQRVDDFMIKRFGDKVKLLETYGPVQMCVFGLTYKHIESDSLIIFECERGFITVALVDTEGKKSYPSEYFEESKYFHFEDKDEDLCELIDSIERLIKQKV